MLKRFSIYLSEMFPVSHLMSGPLIALTSYKLMSHLQGVELQTRSEFFAASATLSLCALLLRLMDEIKDLADDKINFPQRPLPRGAVLVSDLKFLMGVITVMILGLNLFHLIALMCAVVLLLQSWLMFKWFFIEPKIKKSLSLALLTHHPIVVSYLVYLIIVYFLFYPVNLYILLPLPSLAIIFTHWEIARKMRTANAEDNYNTYTKTLGTSNSLILCTCLRSATVIPLLLLLKPAWFLTLPLILLWLGTEMIFYKKILGSRPVKSLKHLAETWTMAIIAFCLAASW